MKTFAKKEVGYYWESSDGINFVLSTRRAVYELLRFAQISIYMNTCNTNPEDNSTEIIEGRIYDISKPSWL